MEITGIAWRVIAEVGAFVGPPAAPARSQKNNSSRRYLSVCLLPIGYIVCTQGVVGVCRGLPRHVDDDGGPTEAVNWNGRRCLSLAGEMKRRIDMGTTVLGGTKPV